MSQKRPAGEPPELTGYDHVRLLGSGGFADVFLYSQHLPKRNVAVKVMTEEAAEGQSREQFTAEANLMAQLSSHSSIVSIYHAGTSPDGRPFLVMQYCPLPNLAERTRRRPLGIAESVGIGVRLSGALETAHRAGIVHRDIKPANVLTTEYGRPALTDFGIAGLLSNTLTETAGLSIPWAPPEAIDGQVTGVTGDVYSLGATIFTLLVGRSPFTRPGGPNTRLDYTTRIRRDPAPRIEREDLPESLQRVLDKAMAKQPSQRYQSAADLGHALQMIEQEMRLQMTEIEMPDTSWMAPDPQDRRRAPRAALEGREGSPAGSSGATSGSPSASASEPGSSVAQSSSGARSGGRPASQLGPDASASSSGTSDSAGTSGSSGAAGASAAGLHSAASPTTSSADLGSAPPPSPSARAGAPVMGGAGAGGTAVGGPGPGGQGAGGQGAGGQGAGASQAQHSRVDGSTRTAAAHRGMPQAQAAGAHAGSAAPGATSPGAGSPGASSPNQAGWTGTHDQNPAAPGASHPGQGHGFAGNGAPTANRGSTAQGGARRRAGSGVVVTAVVCVMSVVVALIWAFGQLTGDVGGSAGGPEGDVSVDSGNVTTIAMPEQVASPVDLVGTRSGDQVEFTWGVPADLDGQDVSFVWQRTGGETLQAVDEPVVSFSEPDEVCIDVKIRLTNGRTSDEAATTCVEEEA